MEKSISWNDFDGGRFQRFCNSFLFLLLPRLPKVYTAPGKDSGIDQWYDGTFDGKTGVWRFQDKFKSIEKSKAISSLKVDIEEDITSHYTNENFIVYLTNVDLNPTQEKGLAAVGLKALAAKGIKDVEVLIWHHGTLSTHVSANPLLFNWYWQNGAAVLEPFHTYFGYQFSHKELPFQFNNFFVGRIEELKELDAFLKSDKNFLIIHGTYQIGKTRLAIEFLKKTQEQNPKWKGLVLKAGGFSASSFGQQLDTPGNILLLIDEAHHDDHLLKDIKVEIDKHKGKVKCILTVRDIMLSVVKNKIPSHSHDMVELPLKPLSRPDSRELYRTLLPGMIEQNIMYLTGMSAGIPGMIIQLSHQVRTRGIPDGITEEKAFRENMLLKLDEAINQVARTQRVNDAIVSEVVQILALLGPVNEDSVCLQAMADLLKCSIVEVEKVLRALRSMGYTGDSPIFAIRPDIYGEVYLQKIYEDSPSWFSITLAKPECRQYQKNIFRNLLLAGLLTPERINSFMPFINEWLSCLGQPAGIIEINDILETATHMAYRQPMLADLIIDQVLYNIENGFISLSKDQWSLTIGVLRILCQYTQEEAALERYYRQLQRIVMHTGDYFPIRSCFGFWEHDFSRHYCGGDGCCFRQLWLVKKVREYFASNDDHEKTTALEVFKRLWDFEYQLDEFFDPDTMAFHYGAAQIPDCQHTQEIRMELLNGIIRFYLSGYGNETERNKAFAHICRVLLYMFENEIRRPVLFDQTRELEKAVEVINLLLDRGATIREKAAIAHVLELGKTVKVRYKELLDVLKQKVKDTSDKRDRLEQYLLTIVHFDNGREAEIRDLIAAYPQIGDFISDFKKIIAENDIQSLSTLHALIHYLGQHFSNAAKILFKEIIAEQEQYIPMFSAIAEHCYEDEAWFNEVVALAWDKKAGPEYKSTAIAMLMNEKRMKAGYYRTSDLNYIEQAVNAADINADRWIEKYLYKYATIDTTKTFSLLQKYIAGKTPLADNDIFDNLYRDKPFCQTWKAELLRFVEFSTKYLSVFTFSFEPALRFIHRHFGLRRLFNFLSRTIYASTHSDINDWLRARYLYVSSDESIKAKDFFRWLIWVKNTSAGWPQEKTCKMIHYMLPVPHPDKTDFLKIVHKKIQSAKDTSYLQIVAVALRGYLPYTAPILSLQARLAEKYLLLEPTFRNFQHLFGNSFVNNNETCKTSLIGLPATQDLTKKEVLQTCLQERKWSAPVKDFLQEILVVVEEAINAKKSDMFTS